jgi:hypothetical protein
LGPGYIAAKDKAFLFWVNGVKVFLIFKDIVEWRT